MLGPFLNASSYWTERREPRASAEMSPRHEIPQRVLCQVKEEMQREREDELRSRVDGLAMQMAALHCQKAERKTKVLETSRAMLTLHSLLIHNLRERKSLETQDLARCLQNHCLVGGVGLSGQLLC